MFKLCILSVVLTIVCAAPAPKPGAVLAAAPILPAPIVTASSSQVVARNYNTLAAAYGVAPIAAAPIATAPIAYAAPLAAYSTHAVAPAAYAAYSAPLLL